MSGARLRIGVIALAGALAVLALQGAGSAALAAHNRKALDTLSISFSSGNSTFAPVYVAIAEGLFEKHGIQVNTSVDNVLVNTRLVAGQVDMGGTAPPVSLAHTGQKVAVVWGNLDDPGVALISKLPSLAALKAASNCRIATLVPGVSPFAYANYWKNKMPLPNCDIVSVGSYGIIVAGVASGQYTAGITSVQVAATVPSGVNTILSPDMGAVWKQNALPAGLTGSFYALKSTIAAKRQDFIAFIKGVYDAQKIVLNPANDARVAQDLAKAAPWVAQGGLTQDFLKDQIKTFRPYIWAYNQLGYVSPAKWFQSMKAYQWYGIPGFDPKDPVYAYSNIIDMSIYDSAFKNTRTVKATAKAPTLGALASQVFGDRAQWTKLYDRNKGKMAKLHVKRTTPGSNKKLPVGTTLKY